MMKEETIVINHWDSKCLKCGKGATPDEKTHDTVLGYGVKEGEKGCGVEWKYKTSEYAGEISLRPDLVQIDYYNLTK